MEKHNKTLEYLPPSIFNSLITYEPILVVPPKKYQVKDLDINPTIRSISKGHYFEKSFKPHFRESRHLKAIKDMHSKYFYKGFDVSIEDQKKFLYDYPKNNEFKASKLPEKLELLSSKKTDNAPSFKGKKSLKNHRLPPLYDEFYNKFDIGLSNLYISNSKLK
jgi:hypothetical protein